VTAQPALILNVDDNEGVRYATTRVLKQAGFRVQEAATGEEALAAARGVDLVVLDVKLPGLSGFDVCRRIKADPSLAAIPVLHLTSAYGSGEHWATALDAGADAYLTHPVEPVVLVATVRSLLRTRAAEAEVRRAASFWQTTFDSISDGVALLDPDFRILRCNRAFARLVGRAPDEAPGLRAEDLLPGLDRTVLAPGSGTVDVRRERRWLEVSCDPVTGAEERLEGAVLIVTDVTARREAETDRARLLESERAARHEAEKANRLKDEFLATLSHELRTPLNAIVGWATILRTKPGDLDLAQRAVSVIERNARSQKQLIEDILDVSRVVTGKLRLVLGPVDVCGVIDGALESVRPSAQAKQIALEVACPPGLGTVEGDADRVHQVLWNLLSNAVKFTPAGGRVTVRGRRDEGYIELEVADTGAGIAEEFLPHMFERFRQADSSSTRRHGGLGLGLAIVRHLVELHGGTVHAASPGPGQGSTFTVRLPILAPRAGAGAASGARERGPGPEAHPAPAGDPTRLDGITVLVVEDEPDTLDLVATILRDRGAVVEAVSSTRDAREALARARPSVLLSDIGLPGEDGLALIRALRSRPEEEGGQVPAVALTAYAREQDRAQALEAGFQAHLAKPIQPLDLVQVIARVTEDHRRRGKGGHPSW
jgi:PAS domain S-box-containing protein